jgi:asparagine N-glycosylation enzyme membrane subunit Stt3
MVRWAIKTSEESKISGMSKHPFIDGYYIYTMIGGAIVGAVCLYVHLFWQGGALLAAVALFFFLGRWMDAKLKGVETPETISLIEAMKDEEE